MVDLAVSVWVGDDDSGPEDARMMRILSAYHALEFSSACLRAHLLTLKITLQEIRLCLKFCLSDLFQNFLQFFVAWFICCFVGYPHVTNCSFFVEDK